jgi:hypothetical protein
MACTFSGQSDAPDAELEELIRLLADWIRPPVDRDDDGRATV